MVGMICGSTASGQTTDFDKEIPFDQMTPAEKTAAKRAAKTATFDVIRFCADPGNMPLSDQSGEGFQNRIAKLVAEQIGTTATFFWRR